MLFGRQTASLSRRTCCQHVQSASWQLAVRVRQGWLTSVSARACAPQSCTLHFGMFLTHLECSACGFQHEWSRLQNLCSSCHKPLLARVDLTKATRTLTRETLATREKSL